MLVYIQNVKQDYKLTHRDNTEPQININVVFSLLMLSHVVGWSHFWVAHVTYRIAFCLLYLHIRSYNSNEHTPNIGTTLDKNINLT